MPGSEQGAEVVKKAGENIITSGLLGSIAVLCLGIAVVSIYLLYKTQNKRIEDLQRMSKELGEVNAAQKEFHTETNKALEGLEKATSSNTGVLTGIQQTVNNMLMMLAKGGK